MPYNVRIPELSGDYLKDKPLIEAYMKQTNKVIRLLEQKYRKEITNGSKSI